MDDIQDIRRGVEAVLFVADKPVTGKQLLELFPGLEKERLEQVLTQLQQEYTRPERGVHMMMAAGGYQLASNPDCVEVLRRFFKTKRIIRLSGSALETLAIIAYKQPVTRAELEFIRGVNVDGVIKTLSDRNLIKTRGCKDVPGKPLLYVTTEEFLCYFGINSLRDLPQLDEVTVTELEGLSSVLSDAAAAEAEAVPGGDPQSARLRAQVYRRDFPDSEESAAPVKDSSSDEQASEVTDIARAD